MTVVIRTSSIVLWMAADTPTTATIVTTEKSFGESHENVASKTRDGTMARDMLIRIMEMVCWNRRAALVAPLTRETTGPRLSIRTNGARPTTAGLRLLTRTTRRRAI